MWLQGSDVLVVQEFSLVFYLCALAVMVICFAIAIKLIGKYDGD
jgi:hypothetical protein